MARRTSTSAFLPILALVCFGALFFATGTIGQEMPTPTTPTPDQVVVGDMVGLAGLAGLTVFLVFWGMRRPGVGQA